MSIARAKPFGFTWGTSRLLELEPAGDLDDALISRRRGGTYPPPHPPEIFIYNFTVHKRRSHHRLTLGGPLLHGVKTHMAAPLGDGPVCPSSLTNLGLPVMNRTS